MFFFIGVIVLLNALTTTTETVIHQIYVQLLFATAFILIGIDVMFINLWWNRDSICKQLKLNRQETQKLRLLLEKHLPKEPPKEKHFWDKLVE